MLKGKQTSSSQPRLRRFNLLFMLYPSAWRARDIAWEKFDMLVVKLPRQFSHFLPRVYPARAPRTRVEHQSAGHEAVKFLRRILI